MGFDFRNGIRLCRIEREKIDIPMGDQQVLDSIQGLIKKAENTELKCIAIQANAQKVTQLSTSFIGLFLLFTYYLECTR
jgi:hypothetical protein